LLFKSPNISNFSATKKLQNQINANILTQSPTNFFNRLRKNHSISNIGTPFNNMIPRKIFVKNKDKSTVFCRSINNSPISLNNTAKSKQSKSIRKEENIETSQERLITMINECRINTRDLSMILKEMTKNDKSYLAIIKCFVEKIETNFDNKKNEINKFEMKLREKDERIKKLEKEKKDLQTNQQKNKPEEKEKNERNQELLKENFEIKEKIISQQGKIVELKKQEKKFMEFLKNLKQKGIDLDKLYEKKQINKQNKENNKKKKFEKKISPQIIDLDSFSNDADESIINESAESSFGYYGKPFDCGESTLKKNKDGGCEKEKQPKQIKAKIKGKMNLNLRGISNPQIKQNDSYST